MKSIFITLFISIYSFAVIGQLKELTLEDAVLGYYKGLYPESLRNLQWVKNTSNYAYVTVDGLIIKSAKNQKTIQTITLDELKVKVASLEYFPYIEYINGELLVFRTPKAIVYYDYKRKNAEEVAYHAEGENLDVDYATRNIAYTLSNNLSVVTEGKNKVVTENTNGNIVSGQAIHRFEFGISKGTFWSPMGNQLAFSQKDETNVADYPLLDINTTPGQLKSIKYPMAGQKSEHGKIGIYNTENGKVTYLKTGAPLDHFLTNTTWGPEQKYVYLAEVNRDQNHMWLNKYDVTTGEKVKTLFEEQNDKWVEPEHGLYFLPNNPKEFLWLSERDGFMNIYHYSTEGELLGQITRVKWVIDEILGFDNKGEHVLFEGTGEDPRELHAFKVNLKTKAIDQLTKEPGVHHVQYNAKFDLMIDSYSSLSTPKKINVIPVNKGKELALLTADNPLKDYKYGTTELVTLTSKSGEDLYGRLIKPHDFDASKKYPVLVYVYGGPHAQLVTNDWLGGASMWMYWMAEQGYVVFTVDGRGSKHRGFQFESGIHRQLGTLEIEDQLTGVEYLKSLSYIDSKRMAVHGWSFGGFMTTSLMLRTPGTFTTGVAGGPVIDWKWYEIMYGERYMDQPQQNKEGYEKASLLNYVKNLDGDLLMIHGTVDDVVVMQHNLAFVQQCVKEGVQIDFFPYPMHPHNVRGKDRVHLMTKVLNYILEKNQ
ncbi:MAG: S9 family peptidase [Flavobacteriales bacterium]|jgi:dipeptidyl-peptidase-4|nr:S9 family peptidase [Flavobacteriales bacterium]